MKRYFIILLLASVILPSCQSDQNSTTKAPFIWENASIYFLLTDRFNNGDPTNDLQFNRIKEPAVNRGFMGGDIKGITQKIKEGYFNELGITAIWLTPFFEQIHGATNEGTGNTYAFHGYWPIDFTAIDPNFGTEEDLKEFAQTAHENGIRLVFDVIINHRGPVTDEDPVWEDYWVRTEPQCSWENYKNVVTCTLVENLPDILTESEEETPLPQQLLDKWKKEGRLDQELAELDKFFEETGYPRAPKYYIIKWISDYVREYGFNAYRLDTAKHTEGGVWEILRTEVDKAWAEWRGNNPDLFPDEEHFFMFGEVYNYNLSNGRWFSYGDTLVDFFASGIDNLINFEFKWKAQESYEELFSTTSTYLHNELQGLSVTNYLASHDDGDPFDKMREKPFEAANKLLLAPGVSQIYYGDESSRILRAEGAEGDAHLRSFMNWDDIDSNQLISGIPVNEVLSHYQKLGQFRKNHPAIGAGIHQMTSDEPYLFSRRYESDKFSETVLVGLELNSGIKKLSVQGIFNEKTEIRDAYSGKECVVRNGMIEIDTEYDIVLLEIKE